MNRLIVRGCLSNSSKMKPKTYSCSNFFRLSRGNELEGSVIVKELGLYCTSGFSKKSMVDTRQNRFYYKLGNGEFTILSSKIFFGNKSNNLFVTSNVCCQSVRYFSDEATASRGVFHDALFNSPPVLFAQECVLYVHDVSGLSWFSTIVLTTVFLRTTITLPLSLYQQYILAKVENIQLELKEISKEMGKEVSIAVKKFNWSEDQAKLVYIRSMKKQWKKLIERENCHPAKASLLVLVQVPMWVSLSLGLRNLVYLLPVPDIAAQLTLLELSGGGTLWFLNLAVPDSTWILPIILGLTNLSNIELQSMSKVNKTSKFQKYLKIFLRSVCIVMVPVAGSVPSCLCLYWVTSSSIGLIHNIIQLSPRVRRFCNIPKTASVPEKPYKHIYGKLTSRFGLRTPPPPSAT